MRKALAHYSQTALEGLGGHHGAHADAVSLMVGQTWGQELHSSRHIFS